MIAMPVLRGGGPAMRRRRLRGERGKAPWLPLAIGKAASAADQGNRSAAHDDIPHDQPVLPSEATTWVHRSRRNTLQPHGNCASNVGADGLRGARDRQFS